MSKIKHRILIDIAKLIDLLIMTVPFIGCWVLFYAKDIYRPLNWFGNIMIIIAYSIILLVMLRVYDAAMISLHKASEMFYSQTLAFLISDGIIYLFICVLKGGYSNLLPGILCIICQFVMAYLWCRLVNVWYFKTFKTKKTIVIYDEREGLEELIADYELNKKYNVERTEQIKEILYNMAVLNEYEVVFLSDVHSHDRNIISKYCIEKDIEMYIIPRLGDIIFSGADNMHMFHVPIFRLRRYNPHVEYLFAKRCFDIFVSGVTLVLFSPLMFFTAIAIKLYDKGPIFYKQTRLTKDGKEFEILKFRSMRVDAEKYTGAILSAGEEDTRITPVGKIIRKIRFDELPQLINILKGDMSIVGPRPERPEIAKQYVEILPEFNLRLQAKAGLTGYAQVYGKYNTTPYNKLQMDLIYIAHPSFIEDIRICMATIKVLFMKESTEGVEKGQITAMDNKQQ